MKTVSKTLIALTAGGLLAGGLATLASADPAQTGQDQAFAGVVVEDVVVMEQLPKEVQSGSIKLTDDSEEVMAAQSRISAVQAARIAATALPGKVVELKLDDENGYLIWGAEVIADQGQEAQLKIDAGNGRLLAGEDEEGRSRWRLWEDNDKDEHGWHDDRD
jgi:uncharacterized membrane protein YkoI